MPVKRVLSIDGGGIRGLIPAIVCERIEKWAGVPIHKLFDLIAGTSTGGIIALGLAVPPNGKPAKEMADLYRKDGKTIFSRPRRLMQYVFRSKYSNGPLEQLVTKQFGGAKVSDATVEILITCYDIGRRLPVYVTRREAKKDAARDYLMREIAMGTSAAPTYFPPYRVGDNVLIDGGMVANNPANLAHAEAKKLWPGADILLVSLGTGTLTRHIPYKKAKNWGSFRWAVPVIDCMFDGSSQATEAAMRFTLPWNLYHRFQPGLSEETHTLDGASEAAIAGMEQVAAKIADGSEATILQLIDTLKESGKTLKAQIQIPTKDQVVPVGKCEVTGSIEDYCGEFLYLFKGEKGRYWPSRRIIPTGKIWQGHIEISTKSPTVVIRLMSVNPTLHDYIQYYEANAKALQYSGIGITHYPNELDRVRVVVKELA
jgi:uncharacterized protein